MIGLSGRKKHQNIEKAEKSPLKMTRWTGENGSLPPVVVWASTFDAKFCAKTRSYHLSIKNDQKIVHLNGMIPLHNEKLGTLMEFEWNSPQISWDLTGMTEYPEIGVSPVSPSSSSSFIRVVLRSWGQGTIQGLSTCCCGSGPGNWTLKQIWSGFR